MNKIDRDNSIDIAKGIGIILVIVGHIDANETTILKECIYQFHVPLFFIISGMFVNMNESYLTFIKKKILRLYLPAIIWLTVFYLILLFADYLIREYRVNLASFIKHNILQLLGLRVNQLGGAMWFLFSLFRSSVIMVTITHITRYFRFQFEEITVTLLMMVAFGAGFNLRLPYHLEIDCIALGFVCLGRLYNLSGVHQYLCKMTKKQQLLFILTGYTLIYISRSFNNIDIAARNLGYPLVTLCSTIAGSLATICLSCEMSDYKSSRIISYIGKNSIWILIGQFLAFKLVTIIQVLYYHEDTSLFFVHPTFITNEYWIFVYLFAGILIPLLANRMYKYVITNMHDNQQSLAQTQ